MASSSSNGLDYTVTPAADNGGALAARSADELEIKLEFGGGLHLLFSSTPKHTVRLPRTTGGAPTTVRALVAWMKAELVSEREEMFGEGEGVRPGILVLINDADWELEGELEYELQDGDEIVFISTLHGG
ncbi:Ubiquitin-related modifier 1 [Cryptotrichosporon argae]